ncbi:tyrosine-type recombinase/integrase [Kitasatospora sp. CM 4170]|uniref:Tyrosine-type recombinase/integrase n=1 Tax=Kitasatospora aburaviensis TaxID=67265 RepID=A0ABW1EUY5_9ACTN|nr:tyrosine-type recombinase/integrase [Kitasatospora sp. CM 4170]WNM49585.1 tyrosine-type recombinase/integrase [Kitasatospora sp. CM 4170]
MLDSTTARALKEHLAQQAKERLAASLVWQNEADFLYTNPDGSRLHPNTITTYFARLVESSGLPPIRLHDQRHCAASLALAAGMEMKEIQAMLGHREMGTTADIYVSLLPDQQQASAEAVADLIATHRRRA